MQQNFEFHSLKFERLSHASYDHNLWSTTYDPHLVPAWYFQVVWKCVYKSQHLKRSSDDLNQLSGRQVLMTTINFEFWLSSSELAIFRVAWIIRLWWARWFVYWPFQIKNRMYLSDKWAPWGPLFTLLLALWCSMYIVHPTTRQLQSRSSHWNVSWIRTIWNAIAYKSYDRCTVKIHEVHSLSNSSSMRCHPPFTCLLMRRSNEFNTIKLIAPIKLSSSSSSLTIP